MLLSIVWNFNPVLFSVFGFEIRWYGLTWVLCFVCGMVLFTNFVKREGYPDKLFDSIFWYATLSTIIGARLGHCFFYDPLHYLQNPIEIFYFRQGGLASHGAALGLLLGLWMFSRKNKMPYLWSLDRIMIAVTVGGALVRIGNFFNSEIYGTPTDLPWGVVFQRAGETVPMHPTQLYEAFGYLVAFGVLSWLYYGKDMARRRPGLLFGLGIFLVFAWRIVVEVIKNPQVDFEKSMALDMGQWLSIPFVLLGIGMVVWSLRRPALNPVPIGEIARKAEEAAKKAAAKPKSNTTGKNKRR